MRFWLLTVVIAGPLVGPASNPAGSEPAGKPQRIQVDLAVRQGDPLGDREAEEASYHWQIEQPAPGPAAVLARTQLTTPEGVKASFRCRDKDEPEEVWADGNRLKLGYQFGVVPTRTAEGTIRLEITMSHTEVITRTSDRLQAQSGRVSYKRTVAPGEVCKLRWGQPHGGLQTWVELKVRPLGP